VLDRDLNAAINLRNEAVCTASSAGSHACGAGGSGSLATESETGRVEAGTNPRLGLSYMSTYWRTVGFDQVVVLTDCVSVSA
ncbi:MAG: hypothetical protein WCD86_02370, partial [Ktedonobacteraceae bacterium]